MKVFSAKLADGRLFTVVAHVKSDVPDLMETQRGFHRSEISAVARIPNSTINRWAFPDGPEVMDEAADDEF